MSERRRGPGLIPASDQLTHGDQTVSGNQGLAGDFWPSHPYTLTRVSFHAAASVLILALLAAGCGLKPAPITNPNLNTVGRLAVRAAQVVNAVDLGQRQIEPLVDAEVLTAPEGLSVAKAFGVAFTQAKNLVAILTLADAASVITHQLQQLQAAREQAKALLSTVGNLGVGVSGFAGRVVVGALGARVSDAVGDLLPGGVQ